MKQLFLHKIFKKHFINQFIFMVNKAGELAGKIWAALSENGQLTGKELKKVIKAKTEKDMFLGLGWLLREDKIEIAELEKDITVTLK
jgi:hypothetical protein